MSRPIAGLRTTPFEPALAVESKQFELGYGHTCGLTADGQALCMGSNEYGQLGTGSPMQRCSSGEYPCSPSPLAVAGDLTFAHLGLDQRTSCGLATDGAIYCWGFPGSVGGVAPADGARTPQAVEGGLLFERITAGFQYTCAIDSAADAWCLGMSGAGALGDGTTIDRTAPVHVPTSEEFVTLSGGGTATCGLTRSGRLLYWGLNSYGQLGFAPGDP